jgi:hypothetical protein
VLQVNQAAISKLEHQSDMYVSTLRRFVAAMGGELRIVAHFPRGDVVVKQFEDIRDPEPADTATAQVSGRTPNRSGIFGFPGKKYLTPFRSPRLRKIRLKPSPANV